jgi:membrane dipeptidase
MEASPTQEAVELSRSSDFIDLHTDTLIPHRLWGYDPRARNQSWWLGRRFFTHLDLPRMDEGGLSGAMWSITTNPFRTPVGRWRCFLLNLESLEALCSQTGGPRLVRSNDEYMAAKGEGLHACFPAIQGGNALEGAQDGPLSIPGSRIVRVTLLHLTNSVYGATSSPLHFLRASKGLQPAGRTLVEQLNAARVFVDLAHIHPKGFWDALEVHDRSQPLLVTHTGVSGIRPHWRNLDDDQLRAVASTGGVVGIIFERHYLRKAMGQCSAETVIEHMAHAIRTVGEDHVGVGSDFDGAITPPADLADGRSYPILVQRMLERGWSRERIGKILGGNFLRCLKELRPSASGLPG